MVNDIANKLYNKEKAKRFEANMKEVAQLASSILYENLDDKSAQDLLLKVDNEIERLGHPTNLNRESILKDITENIWAQRLFCINPTRQNLGEYVQRIILEQHQIKVEKLKGSGKNQITFYDGKKIEGPEGKPKKHGANSDFYFPKHNIYASAKLTQGTGNCALQGDTLLNYIKEAKKYINSNPQDLKTKFLAIADGSFFTEEDLSYLKAFQNEVKGYENRIFGGTITEILERNIFDIRN